MKPHEFWNSTVREVYTYLNCRIIRKLDDFRQQIDLQEAVTNKIIKADSMCKSPKIVPIRESYKELFEEEQERQSPEEITKRMRRLMKK